MKRLIRCMGTINPAHIVPPHNEFNPSIKLAEFKSIVKSAMFANNAVLLMV